MVTTGTYNFVYFFKNSNPVGATIAGSSPPASLTVISAKTQLLDQVKISSISQLINGTSKVLQKVLNCFNDTTISV